MAFKAYCYVIRWRSRSKGQLTWAQKAVCTLDAQGELTPNIEGSELVRLVRDLLKEDPNYCRLRFGKLDRKTIFAAAKIQGITWRPKRGRPRKMGN
jgi:hypothetical protein